MKVVSIWGRAAVRGAAASIAISSLSAPAEANASFTHIKEKPRPMTHARHHHRGCRDHHHCGGTSPDYFVKKH